MSSAAMREPGANSNLQGPQQQQQQLPLTHLSVGQLQEMAQRQQHQIEAQQQVLVAKEQRLKYLRRQDLRQQQMAAEYDRLRRLREKARVTNEVENCRRFLFQHKLLCIAFRWRLKS